MVPSINEEMTILVKNGDFLFRTSGSVLIFDGYKKVYNYSETSESDKNSLSEHVIDTPEQILKLTPAKYKRDGFIFEVTNGIETKEVKYESFVNKKGGHIIILDSKNPSALTEQLSRMKNLMNHSTNTRHDKFR